jgi:endoglycosylceramidase
MRRHLLFAWLAFAACGGEDAPAPTAPAWRVRGGAIRDADGRTVIMRGVNLASAHKASPYFGFHQPPDLERIGSEWGMNAVRFLISWSAIEPERGVIDAAYLDAVAERMGWAREAGLVVVLDMHQDLYGEGFAGGNGAPRWTCDEAAYQAFVPQEPWLLGYGEDPIIGCYDALWASDELQSHLVEAWRRVAERLAGEAAVIGFDPFNEPYWGSAVPGELERGTLTRFYENVVAAVRGAAPGWLAFIEPSSSRNLGIPTQIGPFSFGDVVYAPHNYDAGAETGNGFDDVRRGLLVENLVELRAEADALGAALWVGEYGGSADAPGITPYMDAQYDGAAAVRASSMYWAYDRDDGYGLLRPDGSEKENLLDVLVRPYPARIAGELVELTYDEQTRTFTFRYEPDAAVTAPTILSIPARAYPDGFELACDGCTAEGEGPWVTLATPPADGVVTVHPR